MKVPCPLPLQSPWSPAGYQVVQVGEEKASPSHARSSRSSPEGERKAHKPAPVAWSAVGCQVVQVGEEKVRRQPRAGLSRIQPYSIPPSGKPPSIVPVVLLAAGGIGLMLLFTLLSGSPIVAPISPPPATFVERDMDQLQPVVLAAPKAVFLPEYAAKLPVRAKAKGQAGDQNGCQIGGGSPSGKETFGTAVEFVRSPLKAAQIAKQEHKLTFLLHVSGNFEESKFT